jgi:hypothetical protein
VSIVVVIDGSNVARCSAWRAVANTTVEHELRRKLVDAVAGWVAAASDADEVQLVFDGAGPWAAGPTKITPAVTVIGSGKRSGDELMISIARDRFGSGDDLWIVSSDREVRDIAGASAHRDLDADSFVRVIQQSAASSGARAAAPAPLRRGIAELVDDRVREQLERLRRGE